MKKILTPSLFALVFISGCSSLPPKLALPPSSNRLEVLKKSINLEASSPKFEGESEELANAYLLAMKAEKEGNLKKACDLFNDLSEEKSFPIKEAALVHALSSCEFKKNALVKLWKKTSIPTYLKEFYTELSLKLAQKNNLPTFEAQFSFELIPYKTTQAEKIKLINQAISIAEKLKDEDKIQIYTAKLRETSPLYNTFVNEQNIFSVAKDFEANRKFEMARSLYKQIIDGPYDINDKVKAYNAYRTSYKVERNLKTFVQKTFEMEEFLKTEMNKNPDDVKLVEHWIDSKIALAKTVWTDHKNTEARKIVDELINTKLGTLNQKATMLLIYGSLHLEKKEMTEAQKCFLKAGLFKVTDPALSENIQWSIVWNNYLLKENKAVVKHVEEFIKKSNNQNFIAKLNYWKGRALLHLKKPEEAAAVFEKVFESDPFGYYGIISSIEIKKPLAPFALTVINSEPTGILTLDWLNALDEKILSQKYLKEINSQFKTPAERERAMSLYHQTEWYQGGMRQIYNFKISSRNAMTEKYINIVFPMPYLKSVETLSSKYSVPKELIYAISKQESAFVPAERSWADAFGLMQMIPEKASELSKKYGINYHEYNDLYDPEINLELGTALLKDLREKFQFKFVQSVAAYNASEKVINIWLKERFNGDYFEFIEMIPYEETRNYVKLVFRNYMVYKRIAGKEEFKIEKDFFARSF